MEKIEERHARLEEIYEDQDGSLKEALQRIEGDPTSVEIFGKFYDEVKEMKARNERAENESRTTEHEAKWMKGAEGRSEALRTCLPAFSSIEALGRYLDLASIHQLYNALPGVSLSEKRHMDYSSFLTRLLESSYLPVASHPTRTSAEYLALLQEFSNYLSSFISRSKPLMDINSLESETRATFTQSWEDKTYAPVFEKLESNTFGSGMDIDGQGEGEEEEKKNRSGWLMPWEMAHLQAGATSGPVVTLYCACCDMTMAKDTVWKGHVGSKKHVKSLQKYEEHVKQVSWLEEWVHVLLDTVNVALEATKDDLEKKLARLPGEAAFMGRDDQNDGEDDDFDADDSDDEGGMKVRRRMMKKNYPIGPDGNPLPFWLYRLQGLSHEFKCQICGNASYFGRKAFERHFADTRHAYGLKCLGIENSRDYFEITSIDKVIALHKHLVSQRTKGRWDAGTMQEFEDESGAVLDKATYDLLAKQLGGY